MILGKSDISPKREKLLNPTAVAILFALGTCTSLLREVMKTIILLMAPYEIQHENKNTKQYYFPVKYTKLIIKCETFTLIL